METTVDDSFEEEEVSGVEQGFDANEPEQPSENPRKRSLAEMNSYINTPQQAQQHDKSSREMQRLRSQIRLLIKSNPHVNIREQSKLSTHLSELSKTELIELLENIKDQVGGVSPYASSQAILGLVGTFVEQRFGILGYAKRISNDLDLIAAIDDTIPGRVQEAGNALSIAWGLVHNIFSPIPMTDANEAREHVVEPPTKKAKTNATDTAVHLDVVEPPESSLLNNPPDQSTDIETDTTH
jgi:hypothetical protein